MEIHSRWNRNIKSKTNINLGQIAKSSRFSGNSVREYTNTITITTTTTTTTTTTRFSRFWGNIGREEESYCYSNVYTRTREVKGETWVMTAGLWLSDVCVQFYTILHNFTQFLHNFTQFYAIYTICIFAFEMLRFNRLGRSICSHWPNSIERLSKVEGPRLWLFLR